MIRFIYADQLDAFPVLCDTMFKDRATQFKERLNWEVSVDATGYEIDQYDTLNPMYAIWEMPDGTHGGSMRYLPTTGETMVNDHFTHLTDGVKIQSPLVWECTRFCLSPRHAGHEKKIAAALMLAGCEIGLQYGLDDWVGVFDARMIRIYRRIGWEPTVLGTSSDGKESISVGLWAVTEEAKRTVCARSGFSIDEPTNWFDGSFPPALELKAA